MSGKVAGSSTRLLQQSGQYVVCEHAAARETPGQKHTITFKDEADCCMKEEFQDVVILGGFTGFLKKVLLFPVLMFFHSQ